MKRWLIALSVLVVVSLACVPLALAGQGKPGDKPDKPQPAAAKGKVKFECQAKVIAASAASLEVTVTSGTKTVKAYRGKVLEMAVGEKAKLINATVDPAVPLTLEELVEGAKVHIGGTIEKKKGEDPSFTATKIILQRLPATE